MELVKDGSFALDEATDEVSVDETEVDCYTILMGMADVTLTAERTKCASRNFRGIRRTSASTICLGRRREFILSQTDYAKSSLNT